MRVKVVHDTGEGDLAQVGGASVGEQPRHRLAEEEDSIFGISERPGVAAGASLCPHLIIGFATR